ncbi:Phosphomannomutase/phosphoglucomutase [Triticum urartu]|uniref:Phosphomannomutase/phosphoglucomutase n=1 Tax=Triticum urartu TaxID=4572 RepID=M7Z9X3_TRIUA|nr:Phosphomannomutase/phosphoglucomutase [Triticum urartu]
MAIYLVLGASDRFNGDKHDSRALVFKDTCTKDFHAIINKVVLASMTASHLPYTRNGLKFFTKRGGLSSVEVEGICDRAARKYVARKMGLGGGGLGMPPVVMRVDLMSAYAQHLRDIIKERVAHPTHYDTPLEGFKVIVNAGNGCGGFFAWDVLEKLGADTTGSLHLEPDGMFPNHMPNPEDAMAMSLTRGAVLARGANLGVVFDTDVDRSGVEGKLSGWVLDDCGDCSVDEGCLVDNNDHPIDVDAYMYRAKFYDESQRPLGWVHIRQSVHNPNIALNLQSCVPGGCRSMAVDLFERFLLTSGVNEFVDTSEVQKFVK